MISIGFLETNSIAKGIEAADAVLKAADTALLLAGPCCPGKYHLLFHGEVAAVTEALEAGKHSAGEYLVDAVVIPRVHAQVIAAVGGCTAVERLQSLGVMEFFSVTAAVYAADAAVKAADITLIDVRLGTGIGGKSYVTLTGGVAAVAEAVQCGNRIAGEAGMVFESAVIPNPSPELLRTLL